MKKYLITLLLMLCWLFPVALKAQDVLDEQILEDSLEQSISSDYGAEAELKKLGLTTEDLEKQIDEIEIKMQMEISKVEKFEEELRNLELEQADLSKFATRVQDLDVSEKEIYDGIHYDKDIFDLGKELFEQEQSLN